MTLPPNDSSPTAVWPAERSTRGRYSPGIRLGSMLYVSGQTPVNVDGVPVPGEFKDACRAALLNLKDVVEAADAELRDVVKVTIYLSDMGDWDSMNEVYGEFFEEPYPARTAVGADLGRHAIEVDAIVSIARKGPGIELDSSSLVGPS